MCILATVRNKAVLKLNIHSSLGDYSVYCCNSAFLCWLIFETVLLSRVHLQMFPIWCLVRASVHCFRSYNNSLKPLPENFAMHSVYWAAQKTSLPICFEHIPISSNRILG